MSKSDLSDSLRSLYRKGDGRARPPRVKRRAKGIAPRSDRKRPHTRKGTSAKADEARERKYVFNRHK